MKNLKKILAVTSIITIVGTTSVVFAASGLTPAETVSGLTGKTVEQLREERAAGKTYGAIAKDAGKLDEFKAQMLENKKAVLDQRVKNGTLTQEQADGIYNTIKENQENCDGTGSVGLGKRRGICGNAAGAGNCR